MAQTCDNDELAPALDLLDGSVYDDDNGDIAGVVYFAAEVGRYYAPNRRALLCLAERLDRGEADAYSLWCAEDGPVPSSETEEGAARAAGFVTP